MNEIKDPLYVQPTSDIGFHWIFCKEGNEEVVLQLLNILIDDKEIVSFTRIDPVHTVNADASFRFDLYCKCSDDSRIIVECQKRSNRENFMKRAFAYSAMAVSDMLEKGLDYEYSKVYFIGLLNYNQFPKRKQAITKVRLYTEEDHVLANDNYLQIFVELRKLPKETGNDFPTLFLKAIRDLGKSEAEDKKYADKRLDALLKAANYTNLPQDQKDEYKKYMTTERDTQEYWEEQCSDARIEGFAEGVAQGKEEGREEGEAKGRSDSKLEIARAMKTDGVEVNVIIKYTGLTEEQIKTL